MINKLWHDTDVIVFTVASISISNLHEVLSLFGLGLSITYSIIKIKQDFFNNNKD
jgi:hypothetical protein